MKLKFQKKLLLIGVRETKNDDFKLYNLIDPDGAKESFTLLGTKLGLEPLKMYEFDINLRVEKKTISRGHIEDISKFFIEAAKPIQ